MDYNKQRKEAIRIIEKFVETGNWSKDDICFFVMKETGFSLSFIRDYIDLCIDRDLFKVSESGLILKK